jgi:hypothetical protein
MVLKHNFRADPRGEEGTLQEVEAFKKYIFN